MDCTARIARNLELATKFYDAYRLAGERDGRIDGWEPDDIADGAKAFTSWLGEIPYPKHGREEGLALEMTFYFAVLPDLTVSDFEGWPTEQGCAWRQKYTGHTADGELHELWECHFIKTDANGCITRWEFFDDWIGTPKLVEAATGLTADQMHTYIAEVFGTKS
jgi:hypothetical protein